MPELPTGTVTFLFTDLEGSTRLWDKHADAMRAALARHDEIVRGAVEGHGGQIVKATGDGFHGVFVAAGDAVEAAVGAQRGLGSEVWDETGPLRVRMGLHTGVAEHRDGDYFGSTLNRAARLMAIARGGQVVCSAATADLARDVVSSVEFRDLGEHRLRDLSRPERVYQVGGEGLGSEFGPLQSVDAFPGNLPVQVSSFVGRRAEVLATIEALGESRAVTLTGVGGVGKTRLAVQVAAEVLPEHPDGVWLCELASAADAEAMVQLIAATLGVQPRQGVSLAGSVREFLGSKHVLLVLDNCEHLLDAAGRFAEDVLHAGPGVRILATSREGLGIEGEHLRVVRSLGLPDAAGTTEDAMASDAVRLFADRARAAAAEFSLESSAVPVAEVCRRLDGVPLAIELAAARVAVMSPDEIGARLDERFRLLTGGRRTAVERHQTLRATVDWSHSLLSEAEQRVFARLGCFTGTFSGTAAETVVSGAGIDEWEVLEAITSLVSKSMVVIDHVSGEGVTRYGLLETLRAYARERLDDSGEADQWRRRHARYYAEFAERARVGITGADELIWRPRVRAELDNLRAAVSWALDATESDDLGYGLRILGSLAYQASIDLTLGIGEWAMKAIPRLDETTPALRTAILGAAAFQATFVGDYDRCLELARQALADGIPPNCPAQFAPHATRATALMNRAEFSAALDVMRDAIDTLEGSDQFGLGAAHVTAAAAAAAAQDIPAARSHGEEALRIAHRIRNPSLLALANWADGLALVDTDPDAALTRYEESVATMRSGVSTHVLTPALGEIGRLKARAGDKKGALAALREAVTYAHDLGHRPFFIGALERCIYAFASLAIDEPAAILEGVVSEGPLADLQHYWDFMTTRRQAALEPVRARLGPDRYAKAVRRGSGLEYEQVVQYVRQLFDDLAVQVSAEQVVG